MNSRLRPYPQHEWTHAREEACMPGYDIILLGGSASGVEALEAAGQGLASDGDPNRAIIG